MNDKSFLDTPAIKAAMVALDAAISTELAKSGQTIKALVIAAKTGRATAVGRVGCDCSACTIDLLSVIANASGAEVELIDHRQSADLVVH